MVGSQSIDHWPHKSTYGDIFQMPLQLPVVKDWEFAESLGVVAPTCGYLTSHVIGKDLGWVKMTIDHDHHEWARIGRVKGRKVDDAPGTHHSITMGADYYAQGMNTPMEQSKPPTCIAVASARSGHSASVSSSGIQDARQLIAQTAPSGPPPQNSTFGREVVVPVSKGPRAHSRDVHAVRVIETKECLKSEGKRDYVEGFSRIPSQ